MAVEFICPTCNGTLRVGDESAGRVVRCGACQTMLRVPGQAVAPLAAVPVAPPRAPTAQPRDPEPESEVNVVLADETTAAEPPFAAELDAAEKPPASAEEPRQADSTAQPVGRSWDPDWNKPYDRPRGDRDDDDRPRRRRRPPAPPPGRGALFWVAVVGGLFVLLTVGCCGGLYLAIPGPKWQKHESARGGFKVDLPAAPQTDLGKRAGGDKAGAEMHTEGTMLFGRMEEFAIVYGDIPPHERRFGTDKQRMDDAVKAMKESGEVGALLRQKDITVGGFPAREVEFSTTGGGWYISRIIIADGRVYVLVAGGRFAKPGNENARRFMDSFEITDPKLKSVGQKKIDAENAAAEQQEQVRLAAEKAAGERVKAETERLRVAQEQRTAEEARREQVRLTNETFLRDRYTGPVPAAVAEAEDARVFSFEEGLPAGVSGHGVRGQAAYLSPGASVANFGGGIGINETRARNKTLRSQIGYTLGGWVRVRETPILLFLLTGGQFGPELVVTIDKKQLVAKVAGARRSKLRHEWISDEKWHHVAFVSDRTGDGPKVRLYFDGERVASGPDSAFVPSGAVRYSWVPLKSDFRAAEMGLITTLYPPGSQEPPKDEIVGAIDECVVIGRPLTDAEVKRVAGRDAPRLPVAPAPRPVE